MAYRTRRRRSYRSRGRSMYGSYRRNYRTRSRTRRRRSTGGRTARIVVQVVGGPAGVAASPMALASKGARPVRARY